MQFKHLSIEPYESLLITLEADLFKVEQEDNDGDQYRKAMPVVASAIRELRKMASGGFKNEQEEIAFFRHVWPAFYAWQFYYIEMYRFAFVTPYMPVEEVARMITEDEKKIADFYKEHSYFWPSYISDSPFINKDFTRSYSQSCLIDPLSLVIDQEFSTIGSYKAARGLGYKKYFDFLQQQKPQNAERTGKTKGWKFEWRESRSAAVERIKAEALAESVYVNGAPATTTQLVAQFEETYSVDLRDFNKLLYAADARKKDATPYLTKLINAFKGRKVMLRK
jgi:RteC protein